MDKPLLLDLFCGAGGAAEGYWRAGFVCVGVDLDPKPLRHYPFECWQDDALEVLDRLLASETWHGYYLSDFDAIHASPPCQNYSTLKSLTTHEYPDLLAQTRGMLATTGLPWIMENVSTAPMQQGVMVCGTALGLNVRRHRRFDSSHLLYPPGLCRHRLSNINAYGHGAWNYEQRPASLSHWTRKNGKQSPIPIAIAREAFGCPWMTQDELAECVPPAYTAFLGRQLLAAIPERTGRRTA